MARVDNRPQRGDFRSVTNQVRDYYEHNTRRFLRFGAQSTIHRGLWGPGVQSTEGAAHWIHGELLALLARQCGEREVRWLDLGCGVGASSRWIAQRRPGAGLGVTISETQAEIAAELTAELGLSDRCRFLVADFCALPQGLGRFELIYAIESFVHAPDPAKMLSSAASLLAEGGRLVIVDDMLAEGVDPSDPTVSRFRDGWHATALSTARAVQELAASAGLTLEEDRDLTPLIRLWRPRDHLIHWLVPLIRMGASRNPWLSSLVGGDALQVGLHTGRISHRWLCFRAT